MSNQENNLKTTNKEKTKSTWRERNPEEHRKRARKWNKENPEKRREHKRIFYLKNTEKLKEKSRQWYKENAEKERKSAKKRHNPERAKKNKQIFLENHPEKIKERAQKQQIYVQRKRQEHPEIFKKIEQKRRTDNPKGNLNHRMSTAIRMALKDKKGGRGWESLVGYPLEKLKEHIEKHFLLGMTWENRNLWQIDHKIPKSAFNFESAEDYDFKRAWALKNLQPLWKKDNLIKHNKLTKPFQPALLF